MKWNRFILIAGTLLLLGPMARASAFSEPDHFQAGEIRCSISWDNVSAMHNRILKFGGAAGVHVLNGLEVGYEQQFIVPGETSAQSRSWGYVRMIPFRHWPVNPFVAARFGYYMLPEEGAVALGGGGGAVIFIDDHFAFEASVYSQAVFSKIKSAERQMDVDWRVVVFF